MIPHEKSDAVTRGLREAFGVTTFEDIRDLTAGRGSNPVFRIIVRGSPFLLRINMRAGDLTRHFTCMKAAADAGLAPRVWYTNIEDRLAITDFVETATFPATDALVRIPSALRTLHALAPFPGVPDHLNTTCMFLINKGPAMDAFVQRFRAANVLPADQCEELFATSSQLAAVYPRHHPDMVSSHNDLFKPDNILFDGQRVWLADWEAASLNDRYADLAVVANMIVTNDDEENAYLQEYFGYPPDPYQRARFFLMQQVAHLFYVMAFVFMGAAGRQLNLVDIAPRSQDFSRRFWEREFDLSDNEKKTAFAGFHWQRLSESMRQPRFNEAVSIVAAKGMN